MVGNGWLSLRSERECMPVRTAILSHAVKLLAPVPGEMRGRSARSLRPDGVRGERPPGPPSAARVGAVPYSGF